MPAKLGQVFGNDILDFSKIIFNQKGRVTNDQILDFKWLIDGYNKVNNGKIKTGIEKELYVHIDKKAVELDIPVNILEKFKQNADKNISRWDNITDVVVLSHAMIDVVDPIEVVNSNSSFFEKIKYKFKKNSDLVYPKSDFNMVCLQSADVAQKLPFSIDRSIESIQDKLVLLNSKDRFLFANYIPTLKKQTIVIGDRKVTLGIVPSVVKGLGKIEQSVRASKGDVYNRIAANSSILSDVVPMYCELMAIDKVSDELQKEHLYNNFLLRSKKAASALKRSNYNVESRLKNMQILYGSIISTELFYNTEHGYNYAEVILNNIGKVSDDTIMAQIKVNNPVLRGQAAFEDMAETHGKQFKKLYAKGVKTK